jgi:hypothetical protein
MPDHLEGGIGIDLGAQAGLDEEGSGLSGAQAEGTSYFFDKITFAKAADSGERLYMVAWLNPQPSGHRSGSGAENFPHQPVANLRCVGRRRVRDTRFLMALKSYGPLAPGVSHAEPVSKTSRLCTGAKSTVVMEMTVITDLDIGLEVGSAEADLYLHWASDLLAFGKDADVGNGQTE